MSNGDNSDNSGFSLGNNSFGFNFDSEDNSSPNNSANNSDSGAKSDEDNGSSSNTNSNGQNNQQSQKQKQQVQVISVSENSATSGGLSATCHSGPQEPLTQEGAAAAAHAQLQNIASQSVLHANASTTTPENISSDRDLKVASEPTAMKESLKRKANSVSSGYKSDDEGSRTQNSISQTLSNPTAMQVPSALCALAPPGQDAQVSRGQKKGKPRVGDMKREERNAREKERSYRITSQINELRGLLSTGGVIVPKGTKNAVLTEAANYIRILQQQQYKSEIHRQQLIQQMQMIGAGQLGSQAANAIRHVAAQNGVWSLGNFGGVPPRSAMSPAVGQVAQQEVADAVPSSATAATGDNQVTPNEQHLIKNVEDHDYRFVFNSCVIGMAIASMGGAFIDCNQLFIQLSEYTKQEICGLTIFNLTAKDDLQNAFDLISQMISPPADNNEFAPACVLRGNMKTRSDLGLNITLIKDEEGIAKCFCVTLVRSPSSPFDDSKPIQATADLIRPPAVQELNSAKQSNMSSPAFMTG